MIIDFIMNTFPDVVPCALVYVALVILTEIMCYVKKYKTTCKETSKSKS